MFVKRLCPPSFVTYPCRQIGQCLGQHYVEYCMRSTTLIVHISGCYSSGLVSFIHEVVNILHKQNRKLSFSFNFFVSGQVKFQRTCLLDMGKLILSFALITRCCSIITAFFFKVCGWEGVDGGYSMIFIQHPFFNPLAYGTGQKLFLFPF